jgi:hypothetical protein
LALVPLPVQALPVLQRLAPVPEQHGWPTPPHARHISPPSVAAHAPPVQVLLLQQ